MDLSIPILGALSYLGSMLSKNNQDSSKKSKRNDNFLSREKPSAKHTFNSTFVKEAELKQLELSTRNYIKAQSPATTNVINSSVFPFNGNSSADASVEENTSILKGPLFNSNADYLFNKYLIEPMQAAGQQLSPMTGLPMEMSHTNMMPYTTIKGDNRIYQNSNVYQTQLHKYTGTDKTTVPKNTEPFFKPVPMRLPNEPTFTQKVDHTRYDTSTRYSGVTTVPQITVGKIPQQLISTPVKTVDQLRNKLYPKVSYEGRSQHGKGSHTTYSGVGDYNQKGRAPRMYTGVGENLAPSSQFKKPEFNEFTDFKSSMKNKNTGTEGYIGIGGKPNSSYFGTSEEYNFITGTKKDGLLTQDDNNIRNVGLKHLENDFNGTVLGNTFTKSQERDTTIYNNYTAPVNKGAYGFSQREYDVNPNKTTNREINITSYSGIAKNPVAAPINYNSFLENNRVNNRPIVEDRFTNGSRQIGLEENRFPKQKNQIQSTLVNYFSNARLPMDNQVEVGNYGSSKINNTINSHDFSSRFQFIKPQFKKV